MVIVGLGRKGKGVRTKRWVGENRKGRGSGEVVREKKRGRAPLDGGCM